MKRPKTPLVPEDLDRGFVRVLVAQLAAVVLCGNAEDYVHDPDEKKALRKLRDK